jgi:hypothetical protein
VPYYYHLVYCHGGLLPRSIRRRRPASPALTPTPATHLSLVPGLSIAASRRPALPLLSPSLPVEVEPIISHPIILRSIPSHPIPRDHPRARTVVQLADLAQSNRFGPPVHHNPASPVLCAIARTTANRRLALYDSLLHHYSTVYLRARPTTTDDTSLLALLPCRFFILLASLPSPHIPPAPSNLHLVSPRLARLQDSHPSRDEFRSAARDSRLATDRPNPRSRQPNFSHIAYHHPSLDRRLNCWRRPLLSPTLNLCATATLSRTSRTHLPARRYISSHKTQRLRVPLSPLTRPPSTHHSPPCSRAVAVTASPSLSLSPSPSYYTPSQHPVYSPISRCTRTPPASQSLAKFRSALTFPPKGYRYCDTGTFLPILAIRTLPSHCAYLRVLTTVDA